MKKLNKIQFIEKAVLIHGYRYDYSDIDYINNRTPIKIKCKIHGYFEQKAANHLSNHGCPQCKIEKTRTVRQSTLFEFIEKANKIHGEHYDYNKVHYDKSDKSVVIICSKHGDFKQKPNLHLNGSGCPKCANKGMTTKEFIDKAIIIHGERYDYSQVIYVNSDSVVKIICKKHGKFLQKPNKHLNKRGCQSCHISKGESEVRKFLIENSIDFIPQKRFVDCVDITSLPFDFLYQYIICVLNMMVNNIQHLTIFLVVLKVLMTD